MEWLNVQDVSKQTEIPVPSVRRYIQKHGSFILSKKSGKKILVNPDCIDVLKRIRKLYDSNMIDSEIDEKLQAEGFTKYIDVDPEEEEITPAPSINQEEAIRKAVAEEMAKRDEVMREWLQAQQEEQREFNKAVLERMDQRDANLMMVVREIQDTKKQIAAAQNKKWWQFWK